MTVENQEEKIEIAQPAVQGEQLVVKPRKKRGRKPSFKPTQFDLDLLYLLREGTSSPDDLLTSLGVAKTELINRFEVLKNYKLVTEEGDGVKLTVNGYNFYTAKTRKKVSLKRAIKEEVKPLKHKKQEKKEPAEGEQKHVNQWLSTTEVVDFGGKLGRMDLQEIMKRYGPTSEQKERFLQRKAFQTVQPKQETVVKKAPEPAGSETCDLCKSSFKIAVSSPELAKYGHCFCGAAYHKDCYDSLLADSARCVRCGKKLLLIIDKQSRDVINKIKDVFE